MSNFAATKASGNVNNLFPTVNLDVKLVPKPYSQKSPNPVAVSKNDVVYTQQFNNLCQGDKIPFGVGDSDGVNRGVISNTISGTATATTGSSVVFILGAPAVRSIIDFWLQQGGNNQGVDENKQFVVTIGA